jgi:Enolase C-terminal domain-like
LAETHRFVREVIGDDADLMIDVNRGWSLQTAIEGARALEDLNIRWLEELLDGPTIIGSWNFSPNRPRHHYPPALPDTRRDRAAVHRLCFLFVRLRNLPPAITEPGPLESRVQVKGGTVDSSNKRKRVARPARDICCRARAHPGTMEIQMYYATHQLQQRREQQYQSYLFSFIAISSPLYCSFPEIVILHIAVVSDCY